MLTARLGRVIAGKVGLRGGLPARGRGPRGVRVRAPGGRLRQRVNDGISTGNAPSTSTQAMNILVMGLESRTNFYGQPLPPALITAMHTGPVGGQDPNTLILIHIFAGGQKAVGYSIPRDDLVTFPHAVQRLRHQHSQREDRQRLRLGLRRVPGEDRRRPPRTTTCWPTRPARRPRSQDVESVTGVHVDHFVETNLAGFYYLAQAFGGVEVCLKPEAKGINSGNYTSSNLYDFNSGFNAVKYDGYNLRTGGAQYLHLSAPQALAFVRERDNLAEGDIDRTRRQQAVIDYVIWQLKHENAFAVGGTITGLLSVGQPVPDHRPAA